MSYGGWHACRMGGGMGGGLATAAGRVEKAGRGRGSLVKGYMLRLIAPVTNDIDVQDSQKLQLSCVSTLGLVPKDLSILGPLAVTQCTARPMTVRRDMTLSSTKHTDPPPLAGVARTPFYGALRDGVCRNIRGPDLLSDPARLPVLHVGPTDLVQDLGLARVHVTEDAHDGTPQVVLVALEHRRVPPRQPPRLRLRDAHLQRQHCNSVDVKGYGLDAKGYMVDGKDYIVDVKGYMVDVKGYIVDAKGYMVDVNGYTVDAKGYMVDVKGYIVDAKGYMVDVKGYTVDA
eukprot:1186469-Prorocentrum_minimum.AAC.1